MKILNWNSQWLGPRSRGRRFEKAAALIARHDPDVICLTEAHSALMPSHGHTITSESSGAGNIENRGGRKVVLWSRFGWSNVDTLGSRNMPPGRFLRAETVVGGLKWTAVGMCVPYHAYRAGEKWGEERLKAWEGACRYLDALRHEILPEWRERKRAILLGDFNMQIPAFNYPYKGSAVNQKRKETFDGWLIPTSGIRKHFIDHVAMSTDLQVASLQFISKFAADGTQLSDHNGVVLEVAPV